MPEGPEVETERLHETIHEELERDTGSLVRRVALTTALFAALAAIASLLAGSTVNEALVLKNEATTLQAQASDQWAYYQAKGIKAAVQDAAAAPWQAASQPIPPAIANAKARYAQEQTEIQSKARELEHQRDEKSAEAEHLLHRHHYFAAAVAVLQVGIALGAIAALTRMRLAWIASCLLGIIGAALFAWPFVG
jgi:glucan biosynthesis protein